jgi:Secretion system C-terminal sorting domain
MSYSPLFQLKSNSPTMKKFLLAFTLFFAGASLFAQNYIESAIDPLEVRFIKDKKTYDLAWQQELRSTHAWKNFVQNHGTWYVHFNEENQLPHRAFGQPISVVADGTFQMAINFANEQLAVFNIPTEQLVASPVEVKGKYTWANFTQEYQGHKVLGSRYSVKFYNQKVVLFACDVYNNIDVSLTPALSADAAINAALQGITTPITFTSVENQTAILPIPGEKKNSYHLVYEVMVKTKDSYSVPSHYYTMVDAMTGQILYRQNMVAHHNPKTCKHNHGQPNIAAPPMSVINASVTGTVHPFNPYDAQELQGFANLYITVGGTNYPMDQSGNATLPVNPGSTGQVRMMGPWSRVYTGGTTPTFNTILNTGDNAISFDTNSLLQERCAYKGVNEIHDHMKFWMPTFTGMDFQLPTNVDEVGTCNAFYDGSSINFYELGGGCNATSLIADVVYHEYGHGINDNYYQSLGSSFNNGAIGEGYADYWGVSLTENPNLGIGFYTDNTDPLREYDADPKVYPIDLVGEVHSDGEIIMGAWYDTHLLLGNDWNLTMPLFVEAYAGLQATTFNGNEGVAFTDVLIDALMADDNDGNITNGTPNGNAIVDGFYLHGITLISNAELEHSETLFIAANESLVIETDLTLAFNYTQYLQSVECKYRLNNGAWQAGDMTSQGNTYSLEIDPQPAGTVIAYYFTATDINGNLSAALPKGAHLPQFANLPYITLCGVQAMKTHDGDDFNQFGAWQAGLSSDNATTGQWEQDDPIGSYTVDVAPGTEVAVEDQHTAGGEICFFTGNASSVDAGIGENDVDGGKTTLQSPVINMTTYTDPIISYWRYYTNSPPGGANPGQDYWQVRMTNDNGANWIYIENNSTQDMSWRRNAFRVADYLTPTAQMRFQFIASDSLHEGQNLNGGSLIEAAMDDFVLYDLLQVGVNENSTSNSLNIYPNPAQNEITVSAAEGQNLQKIEITNAAGQLVIIEEKNITRLNAYTASINVSALPAGVYTVRSTTDKTTQSSSFIKK